MESYPLHHRYKIRKPLGIGTSIASFLAYDSLNNSDIVWTWAAFPYGKQSESWADLLGYYQRLVEWSQQAKAHFIWPITDWGDLERNLVEALPEWKGDGLEKEKWRSGGGLYFITPYRTDWNFLEKKSKLPFPPHLYLFPILNALAWLHEQGIVAYNLAPETIVYNAKSNAPEIGLLNVGLVPPGHIGMAASAYTAPEAIGHQNNFSDFRAELFALGQSFYFWVTGALPDGDSGKTTKALREQGLPNGVIDIILKLCEQAPAQRFSDIGEVAAELQKAVGTQDIAITPHRFVLHNPFYTHPVWQEVQSHIMSLATPQYTPQKTALVITAPPGNGKTRLLQEVQRLCHSQNIASRYLALVPNTELTLTPLWELFPQELIQGNSEETPLDFADFLAWFYLPQPERNNLHTRELMIQQMQGSAKRPLVLLLDDLDLGQAEILEWVESLLKAYAIKLMQNSGRSGAVPKFLLVATVQTGTTNLALQRFFHNLQENYLLAHLTHFMELSPQLHPHASYLADWLGVAAAPNMLLAKSQQVAQGNPLHMRELVAGLLQNNTLYYEQGEWYIAAESIADLPLPTTLPQAITAHVHLLAPSAKAIVTRLRQVGGPIRLGLLFQLCPGVSDMIPALWQLYRDNVIVWTTDWCVTFQNRTLWTDDTEPAASDSLAVLPVLQANLASEQLLLSHLYLTQGDIQKAQPYLLSAWVALIKLGFAGSVSRLASLCLQHGQRQKFSNPQMPLLLAELAWFVRQDETAKGFWKKLSAEPLAFPALLRLTELAINAGNQAEAAAGLKKMEQLAAKNGPNLEQAVCHYLHARLAYLHQDGQGNPDNLGLSQAIGKGCQLLARLFAESKKTERRVLIVDLYAHMVSWEPAVEYCPERLLWCQTGTELAQTGNISSRLPWFLCLWTRMLKQEGHYAAALEKAQKSLELVQKFAQPLGEIAAMLEMGDIYLRIGHGDKAKNSILQAVTLCEKYGLEVEKGVAYLLRAHCFRGEEKYDEALAWYQSAVAILQKQEATTHLVGAWCALAQLAVAQKKSAEAGQYLELAKKLEQKLRFPGLRLQIRLVEAGLESHATAPAADRMLAWDNIVLLAHEYQDPELIWQSLYQRGCAWRSCGNIEKAVSDFQAAWQIIQATACRLTGELQETYLHAPRHVIYEFLTMLTTALPGQGPNDGSILHSAKDFKSHQEPKDAKEVTMNDASLPVDKIVAGYQRELESNALYALREENKNLAKLLEINKRLNSEHDLTRLLDLIMDTAVAITNAERGFLILTTTTQEKKFEVARNFEGEDIADPQFEISHSITEKVIRTGHPLLSTNALEDERFDGYSSVSELKLRSLLAVPLRIKEKIIGALYIDNRFEKDVFFEKTKLLLEAFADQAAIALENTRLLQDNLKKQEELERSAKQIESLNDELALLNAKLANKVERQHEELLEVRYILHHDRQELESRYGYGNIIGQSEVMQDVIKMVQKVADKNIPVLIYGESGTGKELIAKAIHFNSPRKEKNFLTENCAALSDSLLESELFGHIKGAFTGAYADKKGLFELAHEGTLFLDEVGDMSTSMQSALLRVLESNVIRRVGGKETIPVDVKIISASNKELKQLVAKSLFREDLLFRLKVVQINLPPLRKRKEDIPLFIEHFLREYAQESSTHIRVIDKKARELLINYDWPGNVRELRNVLYNVLSLSDDQELNVAHFQELLSGSAPQSDPFAEEMSIDEYARRFIVACQGKYNDSQLSRILGFSRKTLWEKRKKWGIFRNSETRKD